LEIVGEWNGQLVRALRVARRMTVEDFAAKLGLSPRGVAKWESDPDKPPSMASQQLLDVALTLASPEARERFDRLVAAEINVQVRHVDLPSAFDLEAPAALLGAAQPLRATQGALTWHRETLRGLYGADNSIGPLHLLPTVTTHVQAIEQMLAHTSGELLDELLKVGAGYAEFAGWLSQDAGQLTAARTWYDRAREQADAADDRRMTSFVLMRRAVQAIGDGNGAMGVRLAAAAQRDTSTATIRVRAIAAQTQALAHAALGQADDVERQLDLAATLTEAQAGLPTDGDPTSGGRYCELPLYLQISRAKCHLTLGQGTKAVTAFAEVLDALPPSFHRDRGQYLARMANASAIAGLPEQACAQAHEALTIALATGSSRTVADVRRFADRAGRRWQAMPEVSALRDMLGPLTIEAKGA